MIIWFQQIGMQILIWLLGLVDSIFAVFNAAAGITPVDVGEQQMTIGEYFLSLGGVQRAFWAVVIASVAICGVCTIVAIVKNMIKSDGTKSHARTAGQAMSTVFVTLFMGAFMAAGIVAADGLLRAVNNEINEDGQIMSHQIIDVSLEESYLYDVDGVLGLNEYDEEGECTYASYVYKYETADGKRDYTSKPLPEPKRYNDGSPYSDCIIFLDSDGEPCMPNVVYDQKTDPETGDPMVDEDGNPVFTVNTAKLTPVKTESGWANGNSKDTLSADILDESYRTILGSHGSFMGIPTSWRCDGKIYPDSFNFLVGFLCAIIVLIALISATFGLVKRLFDLVLLFIALPGIAATIPLDDGAKFKLWRETVISKVFLAFGSVLAVNVFFLVAPSIWNISIPGASSFVNNLLKVILICGGALTISGGQLLFARLLGTSAEESREMGQSARTLFGGATTALGLGKAAGRGLFGYRNANGQRVGGLIKGGASAVGTVGGGAVNAVGSVVGGQAYKGSAIGRGVSATQKALKGFGGSSGWIGGGGADNPNLGYGLTQGAKKLGGKIGSTGAIQKSGLDNGLMGATSALRQKVDMGYSTRVDAERHAKQRANEIAEAFGVKSYDVKHVKDKRKSK